MKFRGGDLDREKVLPAFGLARKPVCQAQPR
jgi:hypothetical protein